MDELSSLSKARTIILAVSLALKSNISELRSLTAVHPRHLPLQLLLRVLLTFLPESTEPTQYTHFIQEVFSENLIVQNDTTIDLAPVAELSEVEARRRIRKLHLLPLQDSGTSFSASEGPLIQFLVNRARRIEAETGLLPLLPQLLVPFLGHSQNLRTWLISKVLPLLRLEYEYYPSENRALSLEVFERLDSRRGISTLLSKTNSKSHTMASEVDTAGRDMRGLVGPWMYGDTRGKRRRLDDGYQQAAMLVQDTVPTKEDIIEKGNEGRDIDWTIVWTWFMQQAVADFDLVVQAIEQWNGPLDMDLGAYENNHELVDEVTKGRLQKQYAQMALSTICIAEEVSIQALHGAHRILVRVAQLMDLESPAELSAEMASLSNTNQLQPWTEDLSITSLSDTTLLQPHNPMTTPSPETLSFLYLVVLSAYVIQTLGHNISPKRAVELFLYGNREVQTRELQKIFHGISTTSKRDTKDWVQIRKLLTWLRDRTVEDPAEEDVTSEQARGNGIFGKVARDFFERETFKAFLAGTQYQLAVETYIKPPIRQRPLPWEQVERVVVDSAMMSYDNASNGNRTRGGVKKASDIIHAFRQYFDSSATFQRCDALLAATHALSFYSLTLKRGVPFQPVNIRANADPVSLLGKVLDQNARSYTKLDDLLGIGRNLVAASKIAESQNDAVTQSSQEEQERQMRVSERRITGMAIEAALAEDDFETAYSYVINRLPPPATSTSSSDTLDRVTNVIQDDVSWRAAYQAGRFRIKPTSKASSTAHPELRRLEQRMELLSQALLLAPPAALPEILGVWRQCEEDLGILLTQETEAEERWDDRGDRKIPGGFVLDTSDPTSQNRREVARGTNEEAPMGLFDVARGAASALSKSAFPLRGAARIAGKGGSGAAASPSSVGGHQRVYSTAGSDSDSLAASDGEGRVRKRDMVSNMVSGGLASGIGWVLGAPPALQGQSK